MYVLEELWRGNVSPGVRYVQRGSEYHSLSAKLCKMRDELETELSEKGNAILEEYAEVWMQMQSISEKETFIQAFRLGAQMILDVVGEFHGQFKSE